ncbi:MAG TPA: AzlD domain-containing protein [Acidimicrobiales bacterium]
MSAWSTLIVASILTLALRAGPSLLGSVVSVPPSLQRANRFATPALMGALASRGVATQAATNGALPVVAAVVVAAVIARCTRSVTATLAAGTVTHLVALAVTG